MRALRFWLSTEPDHPSHNDTTVNSNTALIRQAVYGNLYREEQTSNDMFTLSTVDQVLTVSSKSAGDEVKTASVVQTITASTSEAIMVKKSHGQQAGDEIPDSGEGHQNLCEIIRHARLYVLPSTFSCSLKWSMDEVLPPN